MFIFTSLFVIYDKSIELIKYPLFRTDFESTLKAPALLSMNGRNTQTMKTAYIFNKLLAVIIIIR